tara:strand:+ start:542 stop:1090 length:549 start_codon:yes stop_codon:yes gene_type:complete
MSTQFCFSGGDVGPWRIRGCRAISGEPVADVARINVTSGDDSAPQGASTWQIRAFTSNLRYAERHEVHRLQAVQEPLDRPEAVHAAMIPIKKSAAWWQLAQDERRAIFEAQSHHTEIGLKYLPEVARQLYHAGDLGEVFDFVTWFEFAPEHEAAFDALLVELRAAPEWAYVEREVDIRLVRT